MRRTSPRGQIVLLALVFLAAFSAAATALLGLLAAYARTERVATARAQATALAEGGIDLAISQLNENASYTGETATFSAGSVTTVVSNTGGATRAVAATAYVPNATAPVATERVAATLSVNASIVSFRYGVQVGAGGLSMGTGAYVDGSIFSDGSISGSGTITGDAIAASGTPATSLSGVTVNGSAYAHSLSSCTIGGDAYYASANSCSVSGTTHPGTADTAAEPFPITNDQITAWEAAATGGGVISGNYSLSNGASATLGPKEIDGNLALSNGATLTLSGTLWVKGNVSVGNNSTLTVSQSYGGAGAVVVADKPGSTGSAGVVTLNNGAIVSGNGGSGSTLMIVTTNTSDEALQIGNNSSSAVLYAPYGGASVTNNAHANQISAYKLKLSNNTTITYDSGLQAQYFSNGPGGTWAYVPGTYALFP